MLVQPPNLPVTGVGCQHAAVTPDAIVDWRAVECAAMSAHIKLDPEFVADFCKRNRIRKLALFGSVLTDRFRPDSDVDVLVEFEEGARVGYIAMAGMEIEL